MRPATTAFADAVGQSHTLAIRVQLLVDGEETGDPITQVISGTVTLDATAATRGRLDLTLIDDGTFGLIPTDSDSDLAPYGNELQVSRGITYPDSTIELIELGIFRIDDIVTSDTPAGVELSISGQDRSARVIDARFEEPYQVAAGTNYTTAIQAVLQAAWPDIPLSLTATSRTTPQLIAEEGADRWAFVSDMAASLGMTIYFDGTGTCVMRPVTATSSSSVASLAEGEGGVLLALQRRWTREGAFNRVIATGENTGETAPARGVATDNDPASPTYYYGSFGKVPRFYVSQFITTDAQAADAAQAILSRELGTTQQISFGTLVDPRLEPDDLVTVTRTRGDILIDENHVIDQLTIPLDAAGTMSGSTRATVVTS